MTEIISKLTEAQEFHLRRRIEAREQAALEVSRFVAYIMDEHGIAATENGAVYIDLDHGAIVRRNDESPAL